MSIQYPHKLFLKPSGEPYKDEGGNWVNPGDVDFQPSTGLETDCRDVPNAEGMRKQNVDGDIIEFSSMVYCRISVPDLKRGDKVKVTQNEKVRLSGEIKRFSRDHFHVRLWVG